MLTTDLVFGAKIRRIFIQQNDVKRLVFLCGFPKMLSCFSFSFFMLMSGYCHFLLPFKGVKRVQSCHERHMQYMLVCFCFAKKRLQRFVFFRIKCLAKVLFLSHGNFSRYEIHMTLDFLADLQFRNERGDERKTLKGKYGGCFLFRIIY